MCGVNVWGGVDAASSIKHARGALLIPTRRQTASYAPHTHILLSTLVQTMTMTMSAGAGRAPRRATQARPRGHQALWEAAALMRGSQGELRLVCASICVPVA